MKILKHTMQRSGLFKETMLIAITKKLKVRKYFKQYPVIGKDCSNFSGDLKLRLTTQFQ